MPKTIRGGNLRRRIKPYRHRIFVASLHHLEAHTYILAKPLVGPRSKRAGLTNCWKLTQCRKRRDEMLHLCMEDFLVDMFIL